MLSAIMMRGLVDDFVSGRLHLESLLHQALVHLHPLLTLLLYQLHTTQHQLTATHADTEKVSHADMCTCM